MKSIHTIKPTRKVKSVAERFWSKVIRGGDDECWNWTGAKNYLGYGRMSIPGEIQMKSHRVSWELRYGQIPYGMNVLHKCDNPPCCNPLHLFLGSLKDNTRDAMRKGRLKAPPVHVGERHPQATITDAELPVIKSSNKTLKALALEYAVSVGTIWRIRKGVVRNHAT